MKAHLLKLVAGVFLAVSVLVTAFAWPAVTTAPRDVPIGVAGPAPFAESVAQRLGQAWPGAFAVTTYPDAAAAREAVARREVYGAITPGAITPGAPAVLTAPAASPAVAQLLEHLAASMAPTSGPTVEQVAPLPAADPRGAGVAAGALPLVLAAIAIGAATALAVPAGAAKVAALVGASASAGLAATLVLGIWLGALPGAFWPTWATLTLGVLAGAGLVAGAAAVLGKPGIALGAATMMLVGNPFSGAASAPEMLPTGWAQVGQALPPGALVSALRSVAFFDGAAATAPLVILTAWAAVGVALVVAAGARPAARAPQPQPA